MDTRLLRAYVVELLGTFAFVLIAGGLACVNVMTTAANVTPGSNPLTVFQPGLLGVAIGQALVWMAMVAWSAPISGGYLNPALTIARWVFGHLSTTGMLWFVGAQLVGGVVAGLMLMSLFDPKILTDAAPYLNSLAFHIQVVENPPTPIWTGLTVEVLLTFFFALAMFARVEKMPAPWPGAAMMAAAVLFAGPLTGAALNPARWFGPAFWQMVQGPAAASGRQALVYVAGPIVGALVAGAFTFRIYEPALKDGPFDGPPHSGS